MIDEKDLAYWKQQRAARENLVQRAKADYIGAGHNTYSQAIEKWEYAKHMLALADAKIRELELAQREGQS